TLPPGPRRARLRWGSVSLFPKSVSGLDRSLGLQHEYLCHRAVQDGQFRGNKESRFGCERGLHVGQRHEFGCCLLERLSRRSESPKVKRPFDLERRNERGRLYQVSL